MWSFIFFLLHNKKYCNRAFFFLMFSPEIHVLRSHEREQNLFSACLNHVGRENRTHKITDGCHLNTIVPSDLRYWLKLNNEMRLYLKRFISFVWKITVIIFFRLRMLRSHILNVNHFYIILFTRNILFKREAFSRKCIQTQPPKVKKKCNSKHLLTPLVVPKPNI